jgi:DNA-binding beta-propeller fold protein YncE
VDETVTSVRPSCLSQNFRSRKESKSSPVRPKASKADFAIRASPLPFGSIGFGLLSAFSWGWRITSGALILITDINAPDGIAVDDKGNIWICANQQDEFDVIDKTGKVIAKRGDFRGIDQNGIAQGLLFPASFAFSRDKQTLYVSNLTLYLPYAGANLAIDSAYTLQVKGYTVSKMPALIPPFPDRFH